MIKMMKLLFDEQSVKLNKKFNEKFDEVKNEIKKQIIYQAKQLMNYMKFVELRNNWSIIKNGILISLQFESIWHLIVQKNIQESDLLGYVCTVFPSGKYFVLI